MRHRLVMAGASLVMVGALVGSSVPVSAGGTDRGPVGFGVVRLDGQQEVGPTGEPGVGDPDGRGTFGYVAFDSQLCYLLTAQRVATPTAAHIHAGARGTNGGIVVFLDTPAQGFSANCITAQPDTTPDTPMILVQSELDDIIANPAGFYANVHNADFPAGAIRGQLR
jgi:CHRD domain